ncbi:MAG TPA: carbohydrate-binding family 9-like protein [Thermoproteota archaeon]|nr:carbohydrate-binding family 9-like protein [Thermoproteota archaeon]
MPRRRGMVLVSTRDGRLIEPEKYVCYRATTPIVVDGRLNDAPWKKAALTRAFVDIEGNDVRRAPRFSTRAMMLWDGEYFYVGADLEEPDVWGTLTKRDSRIYDDNDFEVFIKPHEEKPCYFEFELNALNTIWDLFMDRPYNMGGHADSSWDCVGIRHAVQIDGTLNWPYDVDRGWALELAIPWSGLARGGVTGPPTAGEQWRVNFSRVEYKRELVGKYCDNWAWSCQSEINMHIPAFWGFVQFSDIPVGSGEEPFVDRAETVRPWWEGIDKNNLPKPPDRSYLKKGRINAWEEKGGQWSQ